MQKRTLSELNRSDLEGKRVLVRVDFNVPFDKSGKISDDSRIVAALPTIKYLTENQAKVILVSHLGRPKGKFDEALVMNPIAERLSELLDQQVLKLDEAIGDRVKGYVGELADGQVILLENIRFYKEETENDSTFSHLLADLADLYVNDAFGTAHRAHASTVGVTSYLSPSVAGFLMAKEIEMLGSKLDEPERPFTAIIGGSKVSSKISVLKNLVKQVDVLLIGGGMAYTFIKAKGGSIGKSLCEDNYLDTAREILAIADENNVAVILPDDNICAQAMSDKGEAIDIFSHGHKDAIASKIYSSKTIEANWMALDIGPGSADQFAKLVSQSRTVVWNGPVGAFEYDVFEQGTRAVADALVNLTKNGGTTIIGGGDSVAALEKFALAKTEFSHVSTGGGASLEFLEGKQLPGVACLDESKVKV